MGSILRVGLGFVGGVTLGWAARGFMRLLADDPEFTWSGTLFIVGVFTVFGTVQGIVASVRARTDRRWATTPARTLGGVSYLLLGIGAGSLMVPFLLLGAPAWWRTDWRRWLRFVAGGVAGANVVGVVALQLSEEGFRPQFVVGFVAMVAVYVVTLWTVGPTMGPTARRVTRPLASVDRAGG